MVTYPKHPPPLTAKITFFPQPTKPKSTQGGGCLYRTGRTGGVPLSDKSDRSDKSDESDGPS